MCKPFYEKDLKYPTYHFKEELEQSRREWARERAELTAQLGAADARVRDLADDLALVKAALPVESPHHHMHDDGACSTVLKFPFRIL